MATPASSSAHEISNESNRSTPKSRKPSSESYQSHSGRTTPRSGRSSRSEKHISPRYNSADIGGKKTIWSDKLENSNSNSSGDNTPTYSDRKVCQHGAGKRHESKKLSKRHHKVCDRETPTPEAQEAHTDQYQNNRRIKSQSRHHSKSKQPDNLLEFGAGEEKLGRNMRAIERKSIRKLQS